MPLWMYRIAAPYTLCPASHLSWLPQRLALVVQAGFYSVQRLSRSDVKKPERRHQRTSIRSPPPAGRKDGVVLERSRLLSADILRFRQETDSISRELPADPENLRIWIAEFLRLGNHKLLASHDSAEVARVNILCLAICLTSRLFRPLVSCTTCTENTSQAENSQDLYTD